jgi:Zn-dependent peptidase ImmA (M78 family)
MKSLKDREKTCSFDFPEPPSFLPEWAWEEAREWQNLDEFNIMVRAEEKTGKQLDIEYIKMPPKLWGLHVARGSKALVYLNSDLPLIWRRFALFHELFHLLNHKKGESFWMRTATPMSSFEHQADIFAWVALWPEWREGYQ